MQQVRRALLCCIVVCVLFNFWYHRSAIQSLSNDAPSASIPVGSSSAVVPLQAGQSSAGFRNTHNIDTIDVSDPYYYEGIRKWGCNRMESIFVFVHIGKSGGGNIRPRIAGAALNYTRGNRWSDHLSDSHYYSPMLQTSDNSTTRGKFCNSRAPNFRIPNTRFPENFEGTSVCPTATNPMDLMLNCPGNLHEKCNSTSGIVYVGHNLIGTEIHWINMQHQLPPGVGDTEFQLRLKRQRDNETYFCKRMNLIHPPPFRMYNRKVFQKQCTVTDTVIPNKQRTDHRNYAYFYAQLPVLRSVLVRDPWSWFLSKFFWHKRSYRCDDLESAVDPSWGATPNETYLSNNGHWNRGWLYHDAFLYLFYLCGEDCAARHELNMTTVGVLEAQAAENLKLSFAVVSILESKHKNILYDMLEARVAYLDMSLRKIGGDDHSTKSSTEKKRCKDVYSTPSFRREVRKRLPVVAALERLYYLACQVQEEHIKDLRHCSADFLARYPPKQST